MAHRSNVLAQLETWVLASERHAQGPCNILLRRSLLGLRHRVQMLVEPMTPSDEEMQLLRRRAMTHRVLPGPVVFDSAHDGPRTSYKRPPAPMSMGSTGPVGNVISISRFSGRQRKMPGKFKEPVSPVWKHTSHRKPGSEARSHQRAEPRREGGKRPRIGGLSRQNSRSILTVSKASKTLRAGELTEEDTVDTGARVGEDYQAQVPGGPLSEESQERADVLVWSASGCPLPAAQLDAYVSSALPFLGGPPQDPPNQTGAHPCFPEEIAYHRLAASGGDPVAALASFGASPPPPVDEWSKAEERQFHAAFGKHKELDEIVEIVKTKSLGAVVRFFYLEQGQKKKQQREKKREIETLKKERSRNKAEDDVPPPRSHAPSPAPVDPMDVE